MVYLNLIVNVKKSMLDRRAHMSRHLTMPPTKKINRLVDRYFPACSGIPKLSRNMEFQNRNFEYLG